MTSPFAGLVVYAMMPSGPARDIVYLVIGLVCVCTSASVAGTVRNHIWRNAGWTLVIGGHGLWVVGDLGFTLQERMLGMRSFPAPTDGIHIVAYVLIAAGLVVMVRRVALRLRPARRRRLGIVGWRGHDRPARP